MHGLPSLRLTVNLRDRLVLLVAGAATPLCFSPFGFWWLAVPLLALLFVAVADRPPRERFWRAFWFGFGTYSAGTYWLYISIHQFGGAPPAFAIMAMVLLILILAAFHGLWGLLARAGGVSPSAGMWLGVMPASWTAVEWLRGWIFGGFPWLSTGYGQIDGPLAAWAPVGGVYGTTLVAACLAGALAGLAYRRERRTVLPALALVLATGLATWGLAGRQWTTPVGENLRVSLVQGGISQDRKWLAEELESTQALFLDLTLPLTDSDLILWPEAAIPAVAHEVAEYLESLGELAKARGQQLILGILTYDLQDGTFRNSLLAVGSPAGIYNKRHLVPFGEYFPVPDAIRNVLRLLELPYQDITPGARTQPPLRAGGVVLAPGICYEDVFGDELRDFLPAAGLLINVSNDGWFGDSIAPHQHLQMARFRALEAGRPMLRSTNTGITAIIGADGRVQARAPQFSAQVLTGAVREHAGLTPWIRFGHTPVLIACLLLYAGGMAPGLRARGAARAAARYSQEQSQSG